MKTKRIARRIATMLLTACMLLAVSAPAFASSAGAQAASSAVLQFNTVIRDGSTEYQVSWGTCFFINENTVVTCAHCLDVSSGTIHYYADKLGVSSSTIESMIGYSVTVRDDVTIRCTQKTRSNDNDLAIFTLDEAIANHTVLTLNTEAPALTDSVYAVGFPANAEALQVATHYTSSDVTIKEGIINKIVANAENLYSGKNVTTYLQTSCELSGGDSGAPLVDDKGYVIGICEGAFGDWHSMDYYCAISVSHLIDICSDLGIAINTYPNGGGDVVKTTVDLTNLNKNIEEAKAKTESQYTEDSYKTLKEALSSAEAVVPEAEAVNTKVAALTDKSTDEEIVASNAEAAAMQTKVDDAAKALDSAIMGLKEKKGLSTGAIIGIVAGAVVLIAVVVIIIIASKNKKKKSTSAAGPKPGAPVPPVNKPQPAGPAQPAPGFAPNNQTKPAPAVAPVVAPADERETTVLGGDAGETTVLSQNVNGGNITKVDGNEKIAISSAIMTIGRERSKVDYCISGNTSIGRQHAKFIVRNGVTYIVDTKSTNGTFVNGVKCQPNQEVALKDGDKVTFANEEFIFHK